MQGSERYARLCQRLEWLYGALELARRLEQGALVRWIETHIDAVRGTSRPIEHSMVLFLRPRGVQMKLKTC